VFLVGQVDLSDSCFADCSCKQLLQQSQSELALELVLRQLELVLQHHQLGLECQQQLLLLVPGWLLDGQNGRCSGAAARANRSF